MKNSKICLILALLLFCIGNANAVVQFQKPETVAYDSLRNCYYVSNWDSGEIIKIDFIGNHTVFYSGLVSTAGLHIHDDILYAASNFGTHNGIVGIDLETASEVSYFYVPANIFFNDITTDTSGYLYYTDTQLNAICKVRLADQTISILSINDITYPNGIMFDSHRNRLLVASNIASSPIYAVDINTGEVSGASTTLRAFDGFAEDNLHYLYASYSDGGTVFLFDSSMSGEGTIISSGHNVPEGICFDRLHRLLCVPNMFGNTIDFIPREVDIWATADTMIWAPFTLQFEASSILDITEWSWDFGNGESSDLQAPQYTYDTAGAYIVHLDAVTSSEDTLHYEFPRFINCLADTIWAGDVWLNGSSAGTDTDVELAVCLTNHCHLNQIELPIEFAGDMNLNFDSISTNGCRTGDFELVQVLEFSSFNKRMKIKLRSTNGAPFYLTPGSGPILKVYFHTSAGLGSTTEISFDGYSTSAVPKVFGRNCQYTPETATATVGFNYLCGDTNSDNLVNVSDAVFIINYVFSGGNAPNPLESADVNCDTRVNISDAVYIINYVFSGGHSPCDPDGDNSNDC